MEVAEFIKIGRELLKLLSENEVRINDWKYLSMYEEYKRMRKSRIKYRAVISELSLTHNISRSKVERLIRRLSQNVN